MPTLRAPFAGTTGGTPAQLKRLVAEQDDEAPVTNQDVINYLAKGTTIDKAWTKARSFGVDPNKLLKGSNGENVRRQEFMPSLRVVTSANEGVGGSTADLQGEVARSFNKDPGSVTNQNVINYLLGGGRSWEAASALGGRYGVRIDELTKDRQGLFDSAPIKGTEIEAQSQLDEATLAELSEDISDLTKKLPKDLRDKIAANVCDIRKNAQRVYDSAIASGKTEDASLALRHAYAEGQLRERGKKLDADIRELQQLGQLDADSVETWNELRAHLNDPDLYMKALAADEVFEKIHTSLGVVDHTYHTTNPDKVEPTPTAPIAPEAPVSAQQLTQVEKNYVASLKEDPLFAKRILGSAGFYRGPMSAQWDSRVEQAALSAVGRYRQVREEFGPLDSRSEAAVITLHPNAQAAARQTIAQMNADFARQGNGLTAKVLWGTRTYAQQNALFNQRPKVTNARGGQSNHNFGIAFDIGLFKGNKYLENDGPYRKAHDSVHVDGLSWGGNWRSIQDAPHYQLTIRGREPNIGEMRGLLESGQPLPLEPLPNA